MASALGHNVPRIFTLVFAAGTALAGLAGVIGGNYQSPSPRWRSPWGRSCSSSSCSAAGFAVRLLHRIHPDGLIQTFAVVFDCRWRICCQVRLRGDVGYPFAEVLKRDAARWAPCCHS